MDEDEKRQRLDALKKLQADHRSFAAFGMPLPPLPIDGHANCVVPGCIGYTRRGSRCADHVTRTVS
jgi:hypothetical protein